MILSKPSPKQDSNTERIKEKAAIQKPAGPTGSTIPKKKQGPSRSVLVILFFLVFIAPLLSQDGEGETSAEPSDLKRLEKEITALYNEVLPLYEKGENAEVIALSESIKGYDPIILPLVEGHELSRSGGPTPEGGNDASVPAPDILSNPVTELWLEIHWMRAQSFYMQDKLSRALEGFEKNYLYLLDPSPYVFVDYAACLEHLDKSEEGRRVLLSAFTRLPVWDWYNIYWELGWNAYAAGNDRECLLYTSRAAYLKKNAAGPKYIAALSCFTSGKADEGFALFFSGLISSLRSDEDNNKNMNASFIDELLYLGENFALDDRSYAAVQTALWFLLIQEGRFDELDGPGAYADPSFLQNAFRYVDGSVSGLLLFSAVQALGVFRDLEALPLILDHYVYSAIEEKNFSAYWGLLRMDEEYYQDIHASSRFTLIQRGKDILEIAGSRYREAEEMRRAGDVFSALPAYEEALKQLKRMGYEESLFGVRIRMTLGEISAHLGQVKDGEGHYRRCLEVLDSLPGGRSLPWYSEVLNNLSFVLAQMGLYQEALDIQEKRQELSALLEPAGNHPLHLDVLNVMAILSTVSGEGEKAEKLWLRSLELAKEVPPGELGVLYSRNAEQLSLYYVNQGNYAVAETYIHEVLRGYEAVPYRSGGEAYGRALRSGGLIAYIMGKYDKAESYYRRALDAYAELEPKGKHNDYAYTFSALGELYLMMGRMNQAEKVLVKAVSILRESPTDPMMYLPSLLTQLADLYSTLGEYSPAIDALEEAAQVFMAKPQYIDTVEFAGIFKQMSYIYTDMGLYEEALTAVRKSKALYAELSPRGKHIFYVHALRMEALLLRDVGKEEEALAQFEKILAVTGDFHVKGKNPLYAQTLTGAGLLYELSGMYEKAEKSYVKALSIQKTYAPEGRHPDYVETLFHIARFYDARNEPEKAAPYYLEEQQIREEYISSVFPVLSEKEKTDYYFTMKGPLESFFSFCERRREEDPALIGKALNGVLLTKGILLHSVQKMRGAIVSSGDSELVGKLNQWLTIKGEIAELLSGIDEGEEGTLQSRLVRKQDPGVAVPEADGSSGERAGGGGSPSGGEFAGEEKRISSLEEEANELERFLSRRSRLFAESYRIPKQDWRELRKALSPGEAAVEMVRYRFYNGGWTDEIHYAVFIITPQTELPRVVILKEGARIESELVEEYRRYIKNSTQKLLPWEEDPGRTLYAPLWQEVDSALEDAEIVYYVPDGVYNIININTLKNEEGDFLFTTRSYNRLTSLKDLVRDGKDPDGASGKAMAAAPGEAVLFGFPDYSAPHTGAGTGTTSSTHQAPVIASRDISGEVLTPLPGTGREVRSIGSILEEEGRPVRMYLREKAREEVVKELVRPGILHIATHGFFIDEKEERPPEDHYFRAQNRSAGPEENPLVRSGLMMASAGTSLSTQSVPPDGEDGILTAMEAINLPLEGTTLVALSACETGLGEIKHGEGVYGLQRAFLAAGAEAVLMSLWKVSDEETATFMIELYRRIALGLPVRQAYRETLREMQKRFPSPFYWGAFILLETGKGL